MASPIDDRLPPERCVGVTVRTPAGHSSAFGIHGDDTAGELIVRSVVHFETRGQLESGAFRMGLLRDRGIVDLGLEEQFAAAGVVEGDVLHLISSEPQVDGAVG